jgi:hypothetical protein
MVNNGSTTKLFAGVGLAVPRLGNVRLRLHFLRRGTSRATPLFPKIWNHLGLILSTFFLISCSQTYNISYPSKSIHFYDVIMTDSVGNIKSTELKMTVGEPNFYSFISGLYFS